MRTLLALLAALVTATGFAQVAPSPFGPFSTPPGTPIPRHPNSPFKNLNAPPVRPLVAGKDFEEGKVLIKFKANTKLAAGAGNTRVAAEARLAQALTAAGVSELEPAVPSAHDIPRQRLPAALAADDAPRQELTRWYRAKSAQGAEQTVDALKNDPAIELVELNFMRRFAEEPGSRKPADIGLATLPNSSTDSLYSSQWHLTATYGAKISQAWQVLTNAGFPGGGSRDIVVAVVDSGVDFTHPDLAGNMWVNSRETAGNNLDDDANGYKDDIYGARTIAGEQGGNVMDDNGHGTHVAGIIAAQGGNGGVVGVAYNVRIMAVKAATFDGRLQSADVAAGIYYAAANGADVINMSFGGSSASALERDALIAASATSVLVAAAGNSGLPNEPYGNYPYQAFYPASYNWVLAVMASTTAGKLAFFSNWDVNARNSIEYEVQAPGDGIASTYPGGRYVLMSGTSMAAPVVSGIAALVRTMLPDKNVFSSRFIMGQIAGTAATPPVTLGKDERKYPLVNAVNALTATPTPILSYLKHYIFDTPNIAAGNNTNGVVDAGETIDLGVVIRNHWGKASNVVVTLDVGLDPHVTVLSNSVNYGAVGSFNEDDNGLTYDAQGLLTGVASPFRLRVASTCPNNHIIPVNLTITYKNEFQANSPTYQTTGGFNLICTRGTPLPSLITNDMVLTPDNHWLVRGAVLVASNATLQIAPGTTLEFGNPNPDAFSTVPGIEVQAGSKLNAAGLADNPIEFFPNPLTGSTYVSLGMRNPTFGIYQNIDLAFCNIESPNILASNIIGCTLTHLTASLKTDSAPGSRIWAQQIRDCQILDHPAINNGSFPNRSTSVAAGRINRSSFNKVTLGGRSIPGQSGIFIGEYLGQVTDSVLLRPYEKTYLQSDFVGMIAFGGGSCSNAFLNPWVLNDNRRNLWIVSGDFSQLALTGKPSAATPVNASSNYWGTISETLIRTAVIDAEDDPARPPVFTAPILTNAPSSAYPFVADVRLQTAATNRASVVGSENVEFFISYNRPMDTAVQPLVTFGPATPQTDFTVAGDWLDSMTWKGSNRITAVTGDGIQKLRIAGGAAAGASWLVPGVDDERFQFEVITSGAAALSLQAIPGEGYVDLNWTQDDFTLLGGFNMYRSTSGNGTFTKINTGAAIPKDDRTFRDTSVTPGVTYFYKFKVVKSDGTESQFSNLAGGTPTDTIPPVITHAPLTTAAPGAPLPFTATITDNVGVKAGSPTLFFRTIGAPAYTSQVMALGQNNSYSTTVPGSSIVPPGLEYYISAQDAVSTTSSGRAELPWTIAVVDRPVINTISPVKGPDTGGAPVTINGSNFKAGALVRFGNAAASSIVVVSANRIDCVTPATFPSVADVTVINPGNQTGTLLRGYTYESTVATVSLPTGLTAGNRAIISVPVGANNLSGLASATLVITYNQTVLRALGARTGTLTPGWAFFVNTNILDRVTLSMASGAGITSGSGTLAIVDFEVIGAAGTSTALTYTTAKLNDGAIVPVTAAGSLSVNLVYYASGTVKYLNTSAGVPSVSMTLTGSRMFTSATAANGTYSVGGGEAGAYTLTAAKGDDATTANAISAFDASLVLQHDAGLATLTGNALIAADVDKSGSANALDAFYILQKAVGLVDLPFPGSGKVWEFTPASRSYPNLNINQTAQDFTAILLGDVSGSWVASGSPVAQGFTPKVTAGKTPAATPATVTVRKQTLPRSGKTRLWVLVKTAGNPVVSVDLSLSYPLATNIFANVRPGGGLNGFTLSANTNQGGLLRAAVAGATPMSGISGVLVADVDAPAADIQVANLKLNEGTIPYVLSADGAVFDQDSDGDGVPDWIELLSGTDTGLQASLLRIKQVRLDAQRRTVVDLDTVAGKRYQLWHRVSLKSGQWNKVGAEFMASHTLTSQVMDMLPADAKQGYFLLEVVE